MLYDKRWDKPEVKADPFSLESLIAWLEKQPADQHYDYCDGDNCLTAQYLTHCGFKEVFLTVERLKNLGWYYIASGWHTRNGCGERTFGAALERARKVLRA